jgi:glucans biosynthesis protein C
MWMAALFAIVATHTEKHVSGGFNWQSAVVCFWESFFCLGVCLGLLVLFREKFNRQGWFAKWMTDNCFAVYLFHAPVLVAITLGLQDFTAPKLVKFLIATVLATITAYTASCFVFLRIPLLGRVL